MTRHLTRGTRWLAVSAVTSAAVLLGSPLPDRPASATTASSPKAEAWYRYTVTDRTGAVLCDTGVPAPGCADGPSAGAAPPRPNPYPAETLHVSINGGLDDSVTVLQLTDTEIGDTITGGTLTLPIAPAEDGTSGHALARFQACAVQEPVEDGVEAGAPAEMPEIDCTVSSRAVLSAPAGDGDAEDHGVFEVDLAPFAPRWSDEVPAVALVPTDAARSESDTWHVAFHGRDREVDGAEPITFVLTVTPTSVAPDREPPDDGPTQGSTGRASVTPPPAPSRPPAAPPPMFDEVTEPAVVEAPDVAPPLADEPAAPQTTQQPVAAGLAVAPVGALYPGAYAVPLVALVIGGVAARSLVRPLRLPDEPDYTVRLSGGV